jgi:hypothetical protein
MHGPVAFDSIDPIGGRFDEDIHNTGRDLG